MNTSAIIHAGPAQDIWDEALVRSGINPEGITEYNTHSRELIEGAISLADELAAGPHHVNEEIQRTIAQLRAISSHMQNMETMIARYRETIAGVDRRIEQSISDMRSNPSVMQARDHLKKPYILLDEAIRLAGEAKASRLASLPPRTAVVNEQGKEEIRQFLKLNGRGLSTNVTDGDVSALALEAELKMADGEPPAVTLKAARCVRGKDMSMTISEEGVDRL